MYCFIGSVINVGVHNDPMLSASLGLNLIVVTPTE